MLKHTRYCMATQGRGITWGPRRRERRRQDQYNGDRWEPGSGNCSQTVSSFSFSVYFWAVRLQAGCAIVCVWKGLGNTIVVVSACECACVLCDPHAILGRAVLRDNGRAVGLQNHQKDRHHYRHHSCAWEPHCQLRQHLPTPLHVCMLNMLEKTGILYIKIISFFVNREVLEKERTSSCTNLGETLKLSEQFLYYGTSQDNLL